MDVQETSTCLTVKKITKEDDGLYSLVAENEVGEATAKFDIEILGMFHSLVKWPDFNPFVSVRLIDRSIQNCFKRQTHRRLSCHV